MKTSVLELASSSVSSSATAPTKQIVVNSDLGFGTTGEWEYDPPEYIGGSGDTLGMEWQDGGKIGRAHV